VDKRKTLLELVKEQAVSLDGSGFVKSRKEIVKCTLLEYMNVIDKRVDVVVCANGEQKRRLKQMFSGAKGGAWNDLEYTLPVIEEDEDEDGGEIGGEIDFLKELRELFEVWSVAEWIDLRKGKEAFERPGNGDFSVDGFLNKEPSDEIVMAINSLRIEPLGPMREEDRAKIFWGGGKPPQSKKARESFVRKTFPQANSRLRASDFVSQIVAKAESEWDLKGKMIEMGHPDPKKLAIGQIIRAQGQILFTEGGRFLEYVPQPLEWKESQKRTMAGGV